MSRSWLIRQGICGRDALADSFSFSFTQENYVKVSINMPRDQNMNAAQRDAYVIDRMARCVSSSLVFFACIRTTSVRHDVLRAPAIARQGASDCAFPCCMLVHAQIMMSAHFGAMFVSSNAFAWQSGGLNCRRGCCESENSRLRAVVFDACAWHPVNCAGWVVCARVSRRMGAK